MAHSLVSGKHVHLVQDFETETVQSCQKFALAIWPRLPLEKVLDMLLSGENERWAMCRQNFVSPFGCDKMKTKKHCVKSVCRHFLFSLAL